MIVIASWLVIETATAIYIYRNRKALAPRVRAALRNLLGLESDRFVASTEREEIVRKINYIGRHVQFERQQLKVMGILKDDNVLPLQKRQ